MGNSDQPAHFTCPNGKTFFSSSIVWGKYLLIRLCQYFADNPHRCYWPSTYVWPWGYLLTDPVVLAHRSSSSRRLLPVDPSFPTLQAEVPQCTCVGQKKLFLRNMLMIFAEC
jgi:hypothetical protein